MAIIAVCECGKRFEGKDEYEGRRAICPSCRREFVFQRAGIPVFHEVTEPPPLPPVRGADNHDAEPKPLPADAAEAGRPFWKGPIFVAGAVIPATILAVFFGYLVDEHKTKEFHRRVYAMKLEVDDLVKSGQSRAALDKCEEVLSAIGDPERTDLKMRGYADVVSKTRDRLNDAVQAEKKHEQSDRTGESSKRRRNAKIPIEVSYPVIDEDSEPPQKRTLYVRLNMRITPEVLREIALELKSQEIRQYEYTYIFYYLPGTGPHSGSGYNDPWAISHFAPVLYVVIMGLTIDEEKSLRSAPLVLPAGSELVGAWLVENGYYKLRHTICFKDGTWYYHNLWPGSKGKAQFEAFEQLASTKGLLFKKKDGSDRYVVNSDGSLQIYDRDGELESAPVRLEISPTYENATATAISSLPATKPTSEMKDEYASASSAVYVTGDTGAYHRRQCAAIKEEGYPIALIEAVREKYRRCKQCRPPLLASAPRALKGRLDGRR